MGTTDRPFDPAKMPDRNFRAPDLLGCVEGWRAWSIPVEPPKFGVAAKLRSVTHSTYYWIPRQAAEAECDICKETQVIDDDTGLFVMRGEGIPGEQHGCGFYSAKTLKHLQSMGYHTYDPGARGSFTIVGQVANWGKVIEGSQGWRSQFSYPVKLFVPYEAARLHAKSLRESYGVPVQIMNFLKPQDG